MEKKVRIGEKICTVSSDDNYLDAMGSVFEPHMVKLFGSLVNKDDIVADIGANIGLTAILFSDLSHHVYAFEPSPSTFSILKSNLARTNSTNVKAVNIGLGNNAESLTITFANNNRAGGYVSDKLRLEEGHITEEIQIETLDRFFLDKKMMPSFIKIDVEGFEQNVIKGGMGLLKKNEPIIVMEMNHFCLDVLQRITIPDFLDFMRATFPFLYAVDTDNTFVDLHIPDQAYFVMHEHVVRHRFPNLVGGFSHELMPKLSRLSRSPVGMTSLSERLRAKVQLVMNKIVKSNEFHTQPVTNTNGMLMSDSIPETMSPGEEVKIKVSVSNKGNETWYGYGSHPVLLSYHWVKGDGSSHLHDGLRTPLSCETVPAGQTVDEFINVVAPEEKGHYQLILTLLQEGVCWFEDKDFRYDYALVTVE